MKRVHFIVAIVLALALPAGCGPGSYLGNRGRDFAQIVYFDVGWGLGLSAERITAPGELTGALSRAIAAKRPHLIEVVIEGKVA